MEVGIDRGRVGRPIVVELEVGGGPRDELGTVVPEVDQHQRRLVLTLFFFDLALFALGARGLEDLGVGHRLGVGDGADRDQAKVDGGLTKGAGHPLGLA